MSNKPLDRFPYIEIHDWDDHQPPETNSGSFFRVYNKLLNNFKYRQLSAADRGILHGLWMIRSSTGSNPPRAPEKLRSILGVGRQKNLSRTIEGLERVGFIHFRSLQRRGEKRRTEKKRPDTSSPTAERSAECVPGGFARFWKAYPRKVGKRAAEASWKRQKLEPQADQIIEAVRRQSAGEDWTKDGGQYVPHPTTWLTQGRWDDETTTPEAAIPFIPDSEWYRKHGLKGRP